MQVQFLIVTFNDLDTVGHCTGGDQERDHQSQRVQIVTKQGDDTDAPD